MQVTNAEAGQHLYVPQAAVTAVSPLHAQKQNLAVSALNALHCLSDQTLVSLTAAGQHAAGGCGATEPTKPGQQWPLPQAG
jgi:hypothetical protein